jgi:hypothetical protein
LFGWPAFLLEGAVPTEGKKGILSLSLQENGRGMLLADTQHDRSIDETFFDRKP